MSPDRVVDSDSFNYSDRFHPLPWTDLGQAQARVWRVSSKSAAAQGPSLRTVALQMPATGMKGGAGARRPRGARQQGEADPMPAGTRHAAAEGPHATASGISF